MEDIYFFIGNIIKKNQELYTLLLYDGTIINNVNLETIYNTINGREISTEI